jgi:micrococcal nuclease
MELYNYKACVNRVVDGDTIDVDIDLGFNIWLYNERVRLSGIDTPPTRSRDLEEKAAGLLAADVLSRLLPEDVDIIINVDLLQPRGKYGRIVGTIYKDGNNINHYMIDNNYAVTYTGQAKSSLKVLHLENRQVLYDRGEL